MKASYSKNDKKFVLTSVAAAIVCCIVTSAAYASGVSSIPASIFGVIVSPIQGAATGVCGLTENVTEYFGDVRALQRENDELKEEISALRRELSELAPIKSENEMLYGFLELKRERTDVKFVNAGIISRSESGYTSDFTIDKGSVHGVKKDMAVIAEDGSLLGIIVEAGATYSRGKTLTSYDFSVGIKNARTGEPGMLTGDFELSGQGLSRVCDLADDADYVVGDVVVTSSLGDIYPPGIYVGTVTELVPDSCGYTLNAVISPSEKVKTAGKVMVVTDFDRIYENAELPSE